MAGMRLSEAIRLGSLLRPQAFREYMTVLLPVRSCALGAALEAMGVVGIGSALFGSWKVSSIWPWVEDWDRLVDCPVCLSNKMRQRCEAQSIITHLNDKHRWSRERIADWVETIEPSGPDRDQVSAEREEAVCV